MDNNNFNWMLYMLLLGQASSNGNQDPDKQRKILKMVSTIMIIFLSILALVLLVGSMTSYATPTGYVEDTIKPQKGTVQILGQVNQGDNPTGINREDEMPNSLKSDVKAVIPYLEDVFTNAYNNVEEEIKQEVKTRNLDLEYTMQSFYDFGNPYQDADYQAWIAAYATIVYHGRNNMPLLSDVPFLSYDITEVPIDDTHKYGEVTLKLIDINGLFHFYGYDMEDKDIKDEYEYRLKEIKKAMTEDAIRQSIFMETPASMIDKIVSTGGSTYSYDDLSFDSSMISEDTQLVLRAALSLQGKVPYDWGGKPSKPGYDTTWWRYNSSKGRQNGLDCSGFVQWAYMTAGYPASVTNQLISTYSIRENLEDIDASELEPGDIGLMKNDDNGTNHTGIYLGNGLWIHCSSGKHTVTVSEYGFRYFKKAPVSDYIDYDSAEQNIEELESMITDNDDDSDADIETTDAEIYEFAQLIEHEVGGEGYNAWCAVAEVVMNRVYSDKFPSTNTIHDVIYAPHQFSYVEDIKYITPRAEVIEVAKETAEGRLRYFDNPDVLFFKNPTITDGIPSTEQVDWGKFPWYDAVGATAFYLGE